jgi:hypothetical protein
MAVSPTAQSAIELTIRTAPVVESMHAETVFDIGEAIAAIAARSEKISALPHLRTINSIFIVRNFPMIKRD